MSSDTQRLCGCCPCCCGPTEPSRECMRRNKPVTMSINYIENEAIKMASLWNISKNTEPTLISVKQNLHLFHRTNVLPVIEAFFTGAMKDVWLKSDTYGFQARDFPDKIPIGDKDKKLVPAWGKRDKAIDPKDFIVEGVKGSKQAVYWKAPAPVPGFDRLHALVLRCVTDSGECSNTPVLNFTVPGCKMCNDIMTQQATSSHFLVRYKISDTPLVPLNSILTYKLVEKTKKYSNSKSEPFTYQPAKSRVNQTAKAFNYQGCLGYYIHRCLPERPPAGTPADEMERHRGVRKIMAAFAFIILEVACLTYERFRGLEGGDKALAKPAFRYRGCSEMYLSYLFWIIISNDVPEGVDPDDAGTATFMTLDFNQFHRYLFLEVVLTLAECHSGFASAYELGDVVFGDNDEYFLNRVALGMLPGTTIPPPERIIENICICICQFYTETLKPIFSRHMTNLSPNSYLIRDGADDEENMLYHRQEMVNKRLVSVTSLHFIDHLLEKTTVGDIDTYVECVGAHAVLWLWQRMLETAPVNVERLMNNLMDTLTLVEYRNVQLNASSDPAKPAISEAAAEKAYVMCNALEIMAEPRNEMEVQDLKSGPICSPPRAVRRLLMIGAFRPGNQVFE